MDKIEISTSSDKEQHINLKKLDYYWALSWKCRALRNVWSQQHFH